MSRVLIIGDTHCPALDLRYVDFLLEIYDQWQCDKVIHIGDLVDNTALSFHLKKPQQKDPLAEYEKAMGQVEILTSAFPKVTMLLGNHDVLPYRWAAEVGIPEEMMRDFGSIFNLPKGWNVLPRYAQHVVDRVIYQHGDRGRGGRMSAMNNAKAEFRSVVQGHFHAQAGIEFYANLGTRIFGMQVGCGTDWKHASMEYGIKFSQKPILSCGVVLDGQTPIVEPMVL